jgi:hypothetical protein
MFRLEEVAYNPLANFCQRKFSGLAKFYVAKNQKKLTSCWRAYSLSIQTGCGGARQAAAANQRPLGGGRGDQQLASAGQGAVGGH